MAVSGSGGPARPVAAVCLRRRCFSRVSCLILFAAIFLNPAGGNASLGDSTDLRVWEYVDRGVVLAWTQTYPDEDAGRNVSEYRIFDGSSLLESVTPGSVAVTTECVNSTRSCAYPPCEDGECDTAELRVSVRGLHAGTMYTVSVDAVFSLRGDISGLPGTRSESLEALAYAAPSAPRDLEVQVLDGDALSVSWTEPSNTGLGGSWGTFGFRNSTTVLEAYQLIVSTSDLALDIFSCDDVDSQELCVLTELGSWVTSFHLPAQPSGRRFWVAVRARNLFLDGSAANKTVWIEGKPSAPQLLKVEIQDHFVFGLRWDPPATTGRESGETFDHYLLSFRETSGNFEPCSRDGGPLQCLTTSNIPLPMGCRQCGLQTCRTGEVCFSSEALSDDGHTRYILLGCLDQGLAPFFDNGTCAGPYVGYSNCRTCNTSGCNNATPSVSQEDFCMFSQDEKYCSQIIGEAVTVSLGAPGQMVTFRFHIASPYINA